VLPEPRSGLSFILALFVVVGTIITLVFRIVPPHIAHPYNNSVWFLAQSKYVAWIFAVEILQRLSARLSAFGLGLQLRKGFVTAFAIALAVPSTVQHFLLERNPYPVYGKAIMSSSGTFDRSTTLSVTSYLCKHARPGAVVLTDDDMIAPVLALTKCRVPLGYYAPYLVSYEDLLGRQRFEQDFWRSWRAGKVATGFSDQVRISYIVADKAKDRIPTHLPPGLQEVYTDSRYAVFRFQPDGA
jgi:hypothetical protein